MENNKLHKIDFVFFIGIIIIGMLSAVIDVFLWKGFEGFPVFSCTSIFVSYALWIILLIYSFFKYTEKKDKPKYVRWFMCFLLPFLHISCSIVGWLFGSLLISFFNI